MIITDLNKLRNKSEQADQVEFDSIFKQLELNIIGQKALGLSAPQIDIFKRCFIYYGKCENSSCEMCHPSGNIEPRLHLFRVANPQVIVFDGELKNSTEGCLSIPNKYYIVKRFEQVTAKDDINGQYTLCGEDAIVFQHELDHLNGVLIDDGWDVELFKDVSRNAPCPCGRTKQGKPIKYKLCHGK